MSSLSFCLVTPCLLVIVFYVDSSFCGWSSAKSVLDRLGDGGLLSKTSLFFFDCLHTYTNNGNMWIIAFTVGIYIIILGWSVHSCISNCSHVTSISSVCRHIFSIQNGYMHTTNLMGNFDTLWHVHVKKIMVCLHGRNIIRLLECITILSQGHSVLH